MKTGLKIIIAIFLVIPFTGFSQKDTLVNKLDSSGIKSDSLKNGVNNNISPRAYTHRTSLNPHNYFLLLGNDFKQQATLPFHTKRKDWIRLAEFGAVAAAVSFADEPISYSAVDLKNKSNTVSSASKYITKFGGVYEAYTLAAMASYGFIFKNEKIKTTTLLATHAYITATAWEITIKFLSARQRPYYIDPRDNEGEPTFHGPLGHFKKQGPNTRSYSSFPSGHTTVAFAAATVFAMEYKNRPLIPIISYSAATLIGLSRLTENKHWPTDILFGAVLGILSGKQVVNNYHRFAEIKETKPRSKPLTFNMQYFYGKLLAGFTYNL
ncbi:MAG: phosphatase PAP2 family protein [Ginsengibacter sp.]